LSFKLIDEPEPGLGKKKTTFFTVKNKTKKRGFFDCLFVYMQSTWLFKSFQLKLH